MTVGHFLENQKWIRKSGFEFIHFCSKPSKYHVYRERKFGFVATWFLRDEAFTPFHTAGRITLILTFCLSFWTGLDWDFHISTANSATTAWHLCFDLTLSGDWGAKISWPCANTCRFFQCAPWALLSVLGSPCAPTLACCGCKRNAKTCASCTTEPEIRKNPLLQSKYCHGLLCMVWFVYFLGISHMVILPRHVRWTSIRKDHGIAINERCSSWRLKILQRFGWRLAEVASRHGVKFVKVDFPASAASTTEDLLVVGCGADWAPLLDASAIDLQVTWQGSWCLCRESTSGFCY